MTESIELILMAIVCSTLMVLTALVLIGLARDMRRCSSEEASDERVGESFDASTVAPRVQQVRLDFLSSLAKQPHDEAPRRERVQAARSVVSQRAYFHHLHSEPQEAGLIDA